MGLRLAVVALWVVCWALLSGWLFNPETHLNRGPTIVADSQVAESKRTAVALGALLGALGGEVAVRAARSSPWWAWAIAVCVGALAAGAAQGIHEWRYPVSAGPGQQMRPAWESGAMFSLLGAAVGLPAGCVLTAIGAAARRREEKAQPEGD